MTTYSTIRNNKFVLVKGMKNLNNKKGENMTAEILKIDKRKAREGGNFWYIFFKSGEGKSYRACVYEAYRNYSNWYDIIKNNKVGIWLQGLMLKSEKVVDADSDFKILREAPKVADVPKVVAPANNAPKANVATNKCDLCGKTIEKEIACDLKVNVGVPEDKAKCCEDPDDKPADEFVVLTIHLICRDELFNKIGNPSLNCYDKEKINKDLVLKAKAKAGK